LLLKGQIDNPEEFEKQLLTDIMAILNDPPVVKVDEGDIAPEYVYKFPLTVYIFDWSHLLHQFVLDAMVSHRGEPMYKRVRELIADYKANEAVAITDVCKTMLFMDGQYFSKAFRRTFPSFNLLIWSYHWFQIKLYEALMLPEKTQRDKAVAKAVKDFRQLVSDLPDSAEFDMMPQTGVEAPSFVKAFRNSAELFDNKSHAP